MPKKATRYSLNGFRRGFGSKLWSISLRRFSDPVVSSSFPLSTLLSVTDSWYVLAAITGGYTLNESVGFHDADHTGGDILYNNHFSLTQRSQFGRDKDLETIRNVSE